jgi:glycosyltransferase involved in cell wall biosynthesis
MSGETGSLHPDGKGKRRIVMLLSNPATFDQRPLKEAHALARAGRSVTILAWDRELEAPQVSVFDDGLVVKRLRLGAGHGTPLLTVPKLLLFYAWCSVHLICTQVDAIHCHDVDTLPAGFLTEVVKLGRPKLVYDMHDLPEAFLRFFPLTRYTQAVFLASARRLASAIIVVNDRFVGDLGRLGFDTAKLIVVMNAPPEESGRKAKKRGRVFNIVYYGWLSEERGVKLLMEAVQGLDGVALTIAGRGELEGLVREAAAKTPSIRFLGWLRMNELEPVIADADLIPSLYEPRTKNAVMATPGKLLTAMSLSVPSLVPAGTYQAELVEKYHCGLVVDWNNASDVRGAIKRLATDEELYNMLAAASYEAFRTSFSWGAMSRRLVDLYSRLLPSGP